MEAATVALDQRRTALRLANTARAERSELRKALHEGSVTLADVMAENPTCIAGVPVWDVLVRTRGIGMQKLRRLNMAAMREHINLACEFGRLTPRARAWLAEQVR